MFPQELLRIAGTSELVYWISHFLSTSFTTLLLTCVSMLFLFVFGSDPVIGYSDPLVVFMVILSFSNSTVLHAMFLSVLLTSSEYHFKNEAGFTYERDALMRQ